MVFFVFGEWGFGRRFCYLVVGMGFVAFEF